MAKLKVKKNVKKLFVIVCIISILIGYGTYSLIKIYKQKQYEKTYEYKLINIGYTKDESTTLIDKYKNKELDYILTTDKNNYYIDLIKEKYFIYDLFYEYLEYLNEGEKTTPRDIIEIVNTNTDEEYYSETIETDISKKELMLVNKYYQLDESYQPETLVTIPTTYAYGEAGSKKVTEDTYNAFIKLWEASNNEGYYLMVSSSYRDFDHQQRVYDEYEESRGKDYADTIAARAGHSEHQTGYTIDMFQIGTTQSTFHTTESYNWLINNAHKYGFILRYPEDKEEITGYNFESWHYRYVGIDAATYIYENNITFDEYYAYFVK